jgi:hypothetical protein
MLRGATATEEVVEMLNGEADDGEVIKGCELPDDVVYCANNG